MGARRESRPGESPLPCAPGRVSPRQHSDEELSRLEQLLRRVAYKSGWEFAIRASAIPGIGIGLSVTAQAPDSRHAMQTNRFGRIESVPVGIADRPEDFYRFVFQVVLDHEAHEAAEFFMVDGSRLFDPHAGAVAPPGPGHD